ncbi:SDR family oxidoreductase [Actinomadura sp. NPDC000600]|uniref:SDR family NAD(P)-dependent oxidoreductase n=1 Tax=Actinomadura sp. NPDC000600 TaxID=3154262 RepID=UPI003394059C
MDVQRHAGRIAIVTGAANGIGRATAVRLAREGASVHGCNRGDDARARAQAEFDAAGLDITLHKADVSSQPDVDALVAAVGRRVDVLANVAGVMDGYQPLGDLDDDVWDRVIAVNLTGVMRMSRAVLPRMLAQGGGAIVTVASRAALGAGPAGVSYAASKHGVLGLVKSICWCYGPRGIRSNAVLPGGVESGMHASAGTNESPRTGWAYERAALAKATMPPKARADEIAAAVSWLASGEASNVNGAVMTVDGGWSSA